MGVARKMVKVKEDLVNLLNDCNTELEKKKAEQVDVLRDIPEAIKKIKSSEKMYITNSTYIPIEPDVICKFKEGI